MATKKDTKCMELAEKENVELKSHIKDLEDELHFSYKRYTDEMHKSRPTVFLTLIGVAIIFFFTLGIFFTWVRMGEPTGLGHGDFTSTETKELK